LKENFQVFLFLSGFFSCKPIFDEVWGFVFESLSLIIPIFDLFLNFPDILRRNLGVFVEKGEKSGFNSFFIPFFILLLSLRKMFCPV
jgi:hypothetical protein